MQLIRLSWRGNGWQRVRMNKGMTWERNEGPIMMIYWIWMNQSFYMAISSVTVISFLFWLRYWHSLPVLTLQSLNNTEIIIPYTWHVCAPWTIPRQMTSLPLSPVIIHSLCRFRGLIRCEIVWEMERVLWFLSISPLECSPAPVCDLPRPFSSFRTLWIERRAVCRSLPYRPQSANI